jgi:IS30 family transposase
MKSYRRVALEDRCHIYAWVQEEVSLSEIAKRLGFHKSTISREIHRNSSQSRGYKPSAADQRARFRYKRCRKPYKLQGQFLELIKSKIEEDWSAEQISNRLKIESGPSVSHECIYRYIRANRNSMLKNLRRLKRKRGGGRYVQRKGKRSSFVPNIIERPQVANDRKRIGDWERDMMFALNKDPILVCVDRKSRLVKLARAPDLKGATINKLTLETLSGCGRVYTMTNDRGTEFKLPLLKPKVYYCDPQRPQQRGTVENTIGLIRQYISRKTKVSDNQLKEIENKLNNRPRKVLDYRTPFEVFNNKIVALAM